MIEATDLPPPDLTRLCIDLEHYETSTWAARAILRHEILTRTVIDPCTGTGVLAEVLREHGYDVTTIDIHNWGYPVDLLADFLSLERMETLVGATAIRMETSSAQCSNRTMFRYSDEPAL